MSSSGDDSRHVFFHRLALRFHAGAMNAAPKPANCKPPNLNILIVHYIEESPYSKQWPSAKDTAQEWVRFYQGRIVDPGGEGRCVRPSGLGLK